MLHAENRGRPDFEWALRDFTGNKLVARGGMERWLRQLALCASVGAAHLG